MAEEIIHLFRCADEGGKSTVPAGSRIVLLFGWSAKNRGLVQAFLNAQTTTISLNGAAPIDISDSYGPIRQVPVPGRPGFCIRCTSRHRCDAFGRPVPSGGWHDCGFKSCRRFLRRGHT